MNAHTALSPYERDAWQKVQSYQPRPISRLGQAAVEKVTEGAGIVGDKAQAFVADHPQAKAAVNRLGTGARAIKEGTAKVKDLVPNEATAWAGQAIRSVQNTTAKISRAGLSPKQIVKRHHKHGHPVTHLADLHALDLEQVDLVRGRGLNWYYPAVAALSGVGAGLAISGGELVVVAGAGAAAAPGGAVVAGAIVGDAAFVLAVSSRAVGQIALSYGYDPEDPQEKLFILSAVNLGTAISASAKTAALADISRLTQALVRGKTWAVLNQHAVAKVASTLAPRFGFRLTQKSLGKVVPVAGIVIGGALNWSTLDDIVDAADLAYRRRFLVDKYPHLADSAVDLVVGEEAHSAADEDISVLDELDLKESKAASGSSTARDQETGGARPAPSSAV